MKPLSLLSKILMLNPYVNFDLDFAQLVVDSGGFPILHISGELPEIILEISKFSEEFTGEFGVQLDILPAVSCPLPKNLELIILPANALTPDFDFQGKKIIYQLTNVSQLDNLKDKDIFGIIAKGSESAGLVDECTSFILLQALLSKTVLPIWVQGGVGVHSAAALLGIGAAGVVLDYQCTFFDEMSVDETLRSELHRLDGSETKIVCSQRIYSKPVIGVNPTAVSSISRSDLENGAIYLSEDIGLAKYYREEYGNLSAFIYAIQESIYGHQKQAQYLTPLKPFSNLCLEFGINYPIAQGPMTRVSDVPEFTRSVAENGALPFVALSMLKGDQAKTLLTDTQKLLKGKPWGVGVLGFNSVELWDEQLSYIKDVKPIAVIIAGGRPAQAKEIEAMGIKAFLHVPTASLLDNFLEGGFKNFVFEGLECGGHIGPFSSMVLWEAQLIRLLKEDDLTGVSVFFAGGIHDAQSAAFISIMAAPLVARGANIGVIIGTAYLFTTEIVESGAIQMQFQSQALSDSRTTLLETAPGHVIRCLKTPFTEYFSREKERLVSSGLPARDVSETLDHLNVGRLRIASKGIERIGNELVPLSSENQLNKGLYMIGQAATLTNKLQGISDLHEDVSVKGTALLQKLTPQKPVRTHKSPLDIAIVGMACVFPGAKNLDEYWLNVLEGNDSITEVPDERWDKEMYFSENKRVNYKSSSKWGGFIPEVTFDPIAFGIPPQSLASIDPSQLLSLQVAYDALEDAGYSDRHFDRENTSVIFGVESGSELNFGYELRSYFPKYFGEIPDALDKALPKLTEDSFPGVLANVISGRIANRLDFGGRNYSVDAACASSLAAVDLACQELRSGRSNVALAGAVDLHNDIADYIKFSSAGALTFEGRCKTFDESADGITLGEGVAVLVLKRLNDAVADKDKIYAVIKSVGASSDGKSLGLTAPRKKGQLSAFKRAYKEAGISPAEIGLYEAHGTGTVVGDKTELSSITELMSQAGAVPGQSHIGSVKTQIGHTKCAAGLAAMIKTALSVYHGVKPPTINLSTPNSYYNESLSPFTFNKCISPWLSETRISGISAFGFGGTNFHTVIQNHQVVDSSKSIANKWPAELIVFRADHTTELDALLAETRDLIQENDTIELLDIAYTLSNASSKPILLTIVAKSTHDLVEKIQEVLRQGWATGIYPTQPKAGKVAFLFSGQGSQRINMARALFSYFPTMRAWIKGNEDLESILFPNRTFSTSTLSHQKEEMIQTRNAQRLLGIVDMAIADLLKNLGIVPDMVAGHSYGEIPALCYAGVIRDEDLVAISKARAESILGAIQDDAGAMLAVGADKSKVVQLLENEKGIDLANHNSKKQCAVAGSTVAIHDFADKLKSLNISYKQLPVACAFHSAVVSSAKGSFIKALSDYSFGQPRLEMWSNTTAERYPTDTDGIKERLGEHLISPVLFVEELQAMYQSGARIFIESGPGSVLSNLASDLLGSDIAALNVEQENANGIEKMMHFLAAYVATDREVALGALYEHRSPKRIHFSDASKNFSKKTSWKINGQRAVPIQGHIPGHAVVHTKPTVVITPNGVDTAIASSADHRVYEYLQNLNAIIKSQHEVMINYLGGNGHPLSTIGTVSEEKSLVPEIITPTERSLSEISESTYNHEEVKEVLLSTISEKTGYPVDMLDMEMDLEADLSIDSIKRIEIIHTLRKKITIESAKTDGDVVEKLGSLKTIKSLMDYLNDAVGEPKKEERTVATSDVTHAITKQSLRASLLSIVSHKTGYPEEMLDLSMDLEADLSIDSIKRIEIINQIKKEIGGFGQEANELEFTEKLAMFKNLDSMLTALHAKINGHEDFSHKETVAPLLETDERPEYDFLDKEADEVLRYYIEKEKTLEGPIASEILKDKRFAIIDDGNGVAENVKSYLAYHYAQADVINTDSESLKAYDGLLLINMESNKIHTSIHDFCNLLHQLDFERVRWILVANDQRGAIRLEKGTNPMLLNQGFQGLLNSLNKECKAQCRTIHFRDSDSIKNISNHVVDELLFAEDHSEVFYIDEERHIGRLKQIHWNEGDQRLTIAKEDVVLVLGGAQGITAEILKSLSQEMPARYVLVGRSPLPSSNKSAITSTNKGVIREQLLKKQKFKSPKELDKALNDVYKNNQILRTISSIEAHGSQVEYHSLDVTHQGKLAELIQNLYAKYDRIDGVMHAAGCIDDSFFVHKNSESFKRVYDIKVLPFNALTKLLRKQTKFCVLFSSIASVAGNKGQTDYAAANSVLDQGARMLSHSIEGRVLAINWGPWKGGTGMIDEGLEHDFQRRGIATIPTALGVKAFLKELKYGTSRQVVIMTQIEALTQV